MKNSFQLDYVSIGERVKNIREQKGISQNEMALALKASESTVKRIESGLSKMNTRTFIRLVVFLDVSADYVLGLKR